MTTENIVIKIEETGSKVVKRNIEDIGKTSSKTLGAVELLKGTLAGIAGGLSVGLVKKYADEWSGFSNRIKQATKSNSEFLAVQEKLYSVANKSGQSLSSIGELYSQISGAASELGASQNQIIKFTDTLSKALANAQVPAGQASGALLQLSQALGSGTVRAQEFNSILNGTPNVLRLVAQNIDGAGGSISKLRDIMNQGKLSSQDFFNALLKAGPQVEAAFAKAPLSISAAFTTLNNSIARYIGELDNSLGISDKFARSILYVAEHVKTLMSVLSGVAGAVATAFAVQAVTRFHTAVAALWTLVRANPFGVLVTTIGALVGYISSVRHEIALTQNSVATLGDFFASVGASILSGIKSVATYFRSLGNDILSAVSGMFNRMSSATKSGVDQQSALYKFFFDGVESGWLGVVRVTARAIDKIASVVKAGMAGIVTYWSVLPNVIVNSFKSAINSANSLFEKWINTTIGAMNKLLTAVGSKGIAEFKAPRLNVETDYFKKAGKQIADAVKDGYESQANAVEKWLDRRIADAGKRAQVRLKEINAGKLDTSALDIAAPTFAGAGAASTGNAASAKTVAAVDHTMQAYRQLIDTLEPLRAATEKYREESELLAKVLGKGTNEHVRYMSLLEDKYFAVLNPLQAMRNEMAEQVDMAKMSYDAMSMESELRARVNDLKAKGVELTKDETTALRKHMEILRKETEMQQLRENIMRNSAQYRTEMQNKNLQAISQTGLGAADQQSAIGQTFGFNLQDSGVTAQLNQMQAYYARIDELRSQNLISEETASNARVVIHKREQELKAQYSQEFFGHLANLQGANSKKLVAIGRAATIAQALMNAHGAATKAWEQGGIYGGAMAAAAYAGAIAQVQSMRSVSTPAFAVGGQFKVPGSGGIDSQMVAFRASPGETVSVQTPAQVRKGSSTFDNGNSQPNVTVEPKIINVFDSSIVSQYLQSSDGEKVIVNIMKRNQREIA